MSLDQNAIAELLPDNAVGLITPLKVRAAFGEVATAYDVVTSTPIAYCAFRATLQGQGTSTDPIIESSYNIASVVATAASTWRITLTGTSLQGVDLDVNRIDLVAKITGDAYPMTQPPRFTWTQVSLGVLDLHIGQLYYAGSTTVGIANLVAQAGDYVSVSGTIHL